jgi:hypothetical protein
LSAMPFSWNNWGDCSNNEMRIQSTSFKNKKQKTKNEKKKIYPKKLPSVYHLFSYPHCSYPAETMRTSNPSQPIKRYSSSVLELLDWLLLTISKTEE